MAVKAARISAYLFIRMPISSSCLMWPLFDVLESGFPFK
jgi:hypothetical protein